MKEIEHHHKIKSLTTPSTSSQHNKKKNKLRHNQTTPTFLSPRNKQVSIGPLIHNPGPNKEKSQTPHIPVVEP